MNKKKLIAVAVVGALVTPLLAFAAEGTDVKIFGRAQAEYSSTKIDQVSTNPGAYRQQVLSDNAGQSRWGLDISEDLGNGSSTYWRSSFCPRLIYPRTKARPRLSCLAHLA